MTSTHICQTCSDPFNPSPGSKGLYCSAPCWDQAKSRLYKAKAQAEKDKKIELYLNNPSKCAQCMSVIDYSKRKNKFCSSSCAATYNNTGRVRSLDSRTAMSAKMRKINADNPTLRRKSAKCGPANARYKHGKHIPTLRNCIVCKKIFTSARKTCSAECLREFNSQRARDYLRKNRHKYVGPTQRSYMERTFVAWLEQHGITKGVYGYWDQVHFTHKPDGKVKNGWADFVFVSRRLIIELDGTHHKMRKHLDAVRDHHLSNCRGYKVIRITHAEYVKQMRLKEIQAALGI